LASSCAWNAGYSVTRTPCAATAAAASCDGGEQRDGQQHPGRHDRHYTSGRSLDSVTRAVGEISIAIRKRVLDRTAMQHTSRTSASPMRRRGKTPRRSAQERAR
jgi:hypothetical protein